MNQLLLGRIDNENIYITKHKWDCDWYWGFGYLGNRNLHFHMDSLIGAECQVSKIFQSTKLTQEQWWIIRELFTQAYALSKCAKVYKNGGGQTFNKGLTDIIKNESMNKIIINDLEKVLDTIWVYLCSILN